MLKKAIIPIAGRGTRMLPLTAAVPKALLPLPGPGGQIRCVLHCILAEAFAAGVAEAAIVASPGQEQAVEAYLAAARAAGAADLPAVTIFLQDRPEGFGDAVRRAAGFVGRERFLLMLGDHVHAADAGCPPCAAQVAAAFAHFGGSAMIGMQDVDAAELPRVGAAAGEPLTYAGPGRAYACRDFIEKPAEAAARRRLVTRDLPDGRYLAHCGIYAFGPEIWDCLSELAAGDKRTAGEIQLADAQSLLLARAPRDYRLLKVEGAAYDTGNPEGYARTFARWSVAG